MKRLALLLCLTCLCAPACHRHKGAKSKVDELAEKIAEEKDNKSVLELQLHDVQFLVKSAEGSVRTDQWLYDKAVDELKTMSSPGLIEAQKIKINEARKTLDESKAELEARRKKEADVQEEIKRSVERVKEIPRSGVGN